MTDSHLVAPVAKLASANQDSPQRQVSRCLLYQLSRDEKARGLLAYTEAFPLLGWLQKILEHLIKNAIIKNNTE